MSTINYNYAANVAANHLASNERRLDQTMARLSSGQRVGVGTNVPGALSLHNRLSEEGNTLRSGLDNINYAIFYSNYLPYKKKYLKINKKISFLTFLCSKNNYKSEFALKTKNREMLKVFNKIFK